MMDSMDFDKQRPPQPESPKRLRPSFVRPDPLLARLKSFMALSSFSTEMLLEG